MKKIHKNKSRTTLWKALDGIKEITGVGGRLAVGVIVFNNIPTAGETVTIGDYVFEAQAGASEAAGTSAGTAADPHLFQAITDLATAGASLEAQILAETETTGAWGYLYPDDSVGCDFTTATLTLKFWPGIAGNAVTLAGSAGDETITQPVTASLGRVAPTIESDLKTNVLDTTGSTQTKEYYVIADGDNVGDTASIFIKTAEGSDTPTIVGNLAEGETSFVEALFTDAAGGKILDLLWNESYWVNVNENGTVTFTASA